MSEQIKPWSEFKYVQVPGLANRFIARYLRTQRKNMRRFFQERGLYTLLDRMNQIRKSKQGMMAKNRMFQEVLNEYSTPTTPPPAPSVRGPLQHPPKAEPVDIQATDQ